VRIRVRLGSKFEALPLEKRRLAVEEPRFGKGSGAKEDSSPASAYNYTINMKFLKVKPKFFCKKMGF
jgi:hypothetical protein